MTKIKPETKIQPKVEQITTKSVANESVQVGVSNLKYGHGHYMFDPSKDAMFNNRPQTNDDNLTFIRSAWAEQLDTTKVHQDVQNIIQSKLINKYHNSHNSQLEKSVFLILAVQCAKIKPSFKILLSDLKLD